MKLYIPKLGDQIQLTDDWKFKLWPESRNQKFAQKVTLKDWEDDDDNWVLCDQDYEVIKEKKYIQMSLPKGTILSIDRIYIRKGNEDFDSISFFEKTQKLGRFWVKLEDANNINFEIPLITL